MTHLLKIIKIYINYYLAILLFNFSGGRVSDTQTNTTLTTMLLLEFYSDSK